MKRFQLIISLFSALAFITLSCSSPAEKAGKPEQMADNFIQISQQQFDSENIQIGELSIENFEETISCNGYLAAPADAIAQINTPISGIVQSIHCDIGDNVQKGQVLLTLSSNELLTLQQNFVETSAKMKKVQADYERNKALVDENIGSQKELLNAENEYKTTKAAYQSLKLRLELININPAKIEEGDFVSSFPILAPISGYVTVMDAILGEFSLQQNKIIEIVNVKHLIVKLSVFEKDINKLKLGQTVRFNSLNEKNAIHYATLAAIGKAIDESSKTITCLAEIKYGPNDNLINNTFVEANIIVDKTEAKALPTSAIVKSGKDYYVFVLEKKEGGTYFLNPVKVEIGRVSNGFTEILNGIENEKIITAGVYNLRIE
jgi:membrane fusion protein, heavy metal efflux system